MRRNGNTKLGVRKLWGVAERLFGADRDDG
jgi:hypothetical protein